MEYQVLALILIVAAIVFLYRLVKVVPQQNAELVEESAAAADGLKEQAIRLNAVVGRFQLE